MQPLPAHPPRLVAAPDTGPSSPSTVPPGDSAAGLAPGSLPPLRPHPFGGHGHAQDADDDHEHRHNHEHGHGHGHAHGHDHDHGQGHAHGHEQGHGHGPGHGQGQGPAETRGGAADRRRVVDVAQPILARNDRLAERNRGFLQARGVTAVSLVSAPGSGKTTLVEQTVARLGSDLPVAVVVGDLATSRDAERIRAAGAAVVQITTGTVCHLDAEMVARGLEHLELAGRRLLLIENVGNLVCPADFDLGEAARVVLVSVTEGEDKPLKYPPIFRTAQAVVITKSDLAGPAGTNLDLLRRNVRRMAPKAALFEISARTGDGFEAWLHWLRALVAP